MIDEQNAESKKRGRKPIGAVPLTGAQRQARHRQKKNGPEEIEIKSFEQVAESWMRNDKQLAATDPELHARLLARHEKVVGLEVEVTEILKGVGLYTWPPSPMKRAETLSALTPNPDEIFPMPDVCFTDVKADVLKNGVANYLANEAAAVKSEPLDEQAQFYKQYGFRSHLQLETLQDVREALILYALTTRDKNLDWSVVEEAIRDFLAYRGFSPHERELRKLIQDYRNQQSKSLGDANGSPSAL